MPSMKFRFTTECELTIDSDSYEEAYLQFKDFCHGNTDVSTQRHLHIFPPEFSNIYFEVDDQDDFCVIKGLKGNFKQDILDNLPDNWRERVANYHAPVQYLELMNYPSTPTSVVPPNIKTHMH